MRFAIFALTEDEGASGQMVTAQKQVESAFARNILALLERTEYRRCDSGEDLEAIYRLRYKAFKLRGDVAEDGSQKTSDALDDAPNCSRFGVFIDNELVSSVRLHHLSKATPFAPVMRVFGDIMIPRLLQGATFINPSQFVADPDLATSYRGLPYITLRLAVIANEYFESTACVSMIRDDHAAFYQRVFGSVQVGKQRPYSPFATQVMLYSSECAINMQPTLERFPFFRSTPIEQRLLFGKQRMGEPAPLTVLPTARYSQVAA